MQEFYGSACAAAETVSRSESENKFVIHCRFVGESILIPKVLIIATEKKKIFNVVKQQSFG